jgi:glycosyltransferase involved in cell wall biosynthesis
MQSKVIYIISATYPFDKGEEFLRKELGDLSKQRWMPDNAELNLSLATTSRAVPKKYFITNAFRLLKIFSAELLNSNRQFFIISNWRYLANSFLQAKILSEKFINEVKQSDEEAYFYSVWMDDGALMLSILKEENKINKFVFRLHGYDLFDERRPGNYMPFRYFNFKNAHRIFILSKAGYDYLIPKNIFPEKLLVNYSGLYDHGMNPFDPNAVFTIVSCSNVIAIKRIDKIINVLSLLSFPVKWVHFGEGEKMEEIKKQASTLPSNIQYEFKGHVENEEIVHFYKSIPVNLFIHLSDTEGLGMAIVEAQSFGIPAIAVNVGGVSEVVNDKTGVLISQTTSEKAIAEEIIKMKSGNFNTELYRQGVKKCWEQNFNAEKNYQYFYQKLIK